MSSHAIALPLFEQFEEATATPVTVDCVDCREVITEMEAGVAAGDPDNWWKSTLQDVYRNIRRGHHIHLK